MFRLVVVLVSSVIAFLSPLNAWEDHPDREDHEKTDRLFKACQALTKANEIEIKLLEKKAKEAIKEEFCSRKEKMIRKRKEWKERQERKRLQEQEDEGDCNG